MSIHDYPYPLEICPHKPDGQGPCQACCKHRFIRGRSIESDGKITKTWVECVGCGIEMDPTKFKFEVRRFT